ncbi:GntR family transcriptional regulator [Paenibacillus faecalis]|uniref:GntR family transcriptional regulator n=1 Tax=Paenibacillus faecalis TaxID=2079532 RepID=UPI000D0F77CA|nr:GntR family transcriptional regulator [Paenibacillus faecalis]
MNTRSDKLFEQMKDQVLNMILERGLKPHDPLPSEGELAERFGVSRMTGKMALQALQEEGIVYRLPRRGTFLADIEIEELRQSATLRLAYDNKHLRRNGHYIALIVPLIDDYIGGMITSIELAAKERGFEVVLKVTSDEAAEAEAVRSLSRQPDIMGILLFPVDRKICGDHLLRLKLQKYPIVILDRQFNEVGFDSVSHDHYGGAYEVTSHLLRTGHRNIGFITSHMDKVKSREERYQGYLDALHEWKVGTHTDRILFLELHEGKYEEIIARQIAIQTFLYKNHELTAVFCSDDFLALSTLNAAVGLGLKVPEQLSIAGFSNHNMLKYAQLRMTTVGQPMNDFGTSAVRLLMNRLDYPYGDPVVVRLGTELILNDSTVPVIN